MEEDMGGDASIKMIPTGDGIRHDWEDPTDTIDPTGLGI